ANTLLWSNSLPANGPLEGEGAVCRFRTYNVPVRARHRFSRAVDRAAQRRRRNRRVEVGESYLGQGFHSLEQWGDAFPFRWTSKDARVELRRPGTVAVSFEVASFQPAKLRVLVDGKEHAKLLLEKNKWETLEVGFSERPAASVSIEVTPPFQSEGDDRELGVVVKSIHLSTSHGKTEEVSLDRDRESLLRALPTSELAPNLDLDGQQWGFWSSLKDALLKGPLSPGLARAALSHALRSDAILATHIPSLGLGYGWMAGRLARKPVLMMPFFHLRDPFHHRPWLRRLLGSADRVLCLNATMKSFVEERWGGRAHYLGGGIDPEELDSPKISGRRFRTRYGLDTEFLILMVSRKVASKGYGTACEAVQRLRARGIPCQFVFIGPDEDGVPLDEGIVRYLGAVSRPELLDALDACDVFVLPSSHESFGLAFLEAWMRRKPVVGHARADSVRELIEVGRDGEVVSSADDLSLVLERLLRDCELRERLGEEGYNKVRSRFTWEHVIQRGLDVLQEVSGRPGAPDEG
ncbi:MAG: glycosyltransferase family 4 protein, partial [Vicinamibacteria bacterium]